MNACLLPPGNSSLGLRRLTVLYSKSRELHSQASFTTLRATYTRGPTAAVIP
jgi:hypothetical protein